ncbi:hypothetical protein JW992_15840 [candidate division KSB1 bacterium]|nr:hypothetical protein [candidate division KSB1 bacterium]
MGGRKTKTRKIREIPLSEQLSNDELLQALETLVRALKIDLRYEKGDFAGGMCRVYDQSLIVLQKNDSAVQKITALSRFLCRISLEGIYVPPPVREVMNRIEKQAGETEPVFSEDK